MATLRRAPPSALAQSHMTTREPNIWSGAVGGPASCDTVPDLSQYIGVLPARRTVMEMVKKVTVALLDDLDGTAADETVQFALDGVSYEIDLSKKNAKKLRSALQPGL